MEPGQSQVPRECRRISLTKLKRDIANETTLASRKVLDEADRILTPTFAPELSFIIDQLPKERQTLLFTATLTDPVMALQNKPHTDPKKPKVFTHVSRDV